MDFAESVALNDNGKGPLREMKKMKMNPNSIKWHRFRFASFSLMKLTFSFVILIF